MMNIEEFRREAYAVIDRICEYFEQVQDLPVVSSKKPGDILKQLPELPPEEPGRLDAVAEFNTLILPGITHWQHPKFFAYFPSNTTFESVLADMLSGAVSNPGFNFTCSPICTELEIRMCDWMVAAFGLSDSFKSSGPSAKGGGVILNTASEACLTAAIVARDRALAMLQDKQDRTKLVMYTSFQAHSSATKTAKLLGVEIRLLRTRAEDNWGLRGETLEAALQEDEAAGMVPFFLMVNVGTTSSGAVDRIDEVNVITVEYPLLYVHVDAAWAGPALSVPELREELQLPAINAGALQSNGRGQIDSICINLHKWGLVTFDCSLFLIKDSTSLIRAMEVTPQYLKSISLEEGQGAVHDYRNWQIPLGRRFRSLKIYFVLLSRGVSGLREHIRNGIRLADRFASFVKSDDEYELVTPRRLSLVVFRWVPATAKGDEGRLDKLNRALWAQLESRRDILLTQTVIDKTFCIRLAVGTPSTQAEHVDAAWNIVRACVAQIRT